MKLLFHLLILATPLALTVYAFIAIPPATSGDFLGYVLVGAMAELCAMAFLLPSAHAPAEPDEAWGDTENTWCLPRRWMEER